MTKKFVRALGVLLALLLFTVLTGWQLGDSFSARPFPQAALLAHMAVGLLVAPITIFLVGVHPWLWNRSGTVRATINWSSGLALVFAGFAAWGLGARLALFGSSPHTASLHRNAGYGFTVLLVVHVSLSRALRGSSREAAPAALSVGTLGLTTMVLILTAWFAPRQMVALSVPASYKLLGVAPKTIFTPGRQRTAHGGFIPVAALAGSNGCGVSGCHTQIVQEWKSSMHRHAASNDHYRAQVKLRIYDVKVKPHAGARFCSACHEPIAVLAGEVDPAGRGIDVPENLDEGISCRSCHRMTGAIHLFGNGSYVIAPPEPYLFEGSAADIVARAAIRAKPSAHREQLMRPFLRDPQFCAPCHGLFVGPGTNDHGDFLVQETFNEYRHTKYATSTRPEVTKRCQDCHMPLVKSSDPAAKAGLHRSHRFLGANTMRPFLDGDTDQLKLTQDFLQDGIVSLRIERRSHLKPGAIGRFAVVLTNEKVGHRFPTGTMDMHDLWIEVKVHDADGKRLFASGELDPITLEVDPGASMFKSFPLGKDGEWLYRRDMWNLVRFRMRTNPTRNLNPGGVDAKTFWNLPSQLFMRNLWPDTPEESFYDCLLPQDVRGPLTVTARLRYRKASMKFTNWVFSREKLREGSEYTGLRKQRVSMPITDVVSGTERFQLQP